jgi:hypothetical protein
LSPIHAKSWFQKCQSLRQTPLASTRITAPSARGAATGTSTTSSGCLNAVICAARIVCGVVTPPFPAMSLLTILSPFCEVLILLTRNLQFFLAHQ